MPGASSSVGIPTHSSTNISAMTGTGVEYLEMSAAGSSTRLQTSDTLKTLDATQLPKGLYSSFLQMHLLSVPSLNAFVL